MLPTARAGGRARAAALALAAACFALLSARAALAAEYVDPEGRFSIDVPDGWLHDPTRAATAAWVRGQGEAAAALWVNVGPGVLRPGSESLIESALLDAVEPYLAVGYRLTGSSALDEEALRGHGVETGIGLRLSEPATRTQVVIALMVRGETVCSVTALLPHAAVANREIRDQLPMFMSSFHLTGPSTPAGSPGRPATTTQQPLASEPGDVAFGAESWRSRGDTVVSDDLRNGADDGWAWDLGEEITAPTVSLSEQGAVFVPTGYKLFDATRPAPILALKPSAVPLDCVLLVRRVASAAVGDSVHLLAYEHSGRALVVTATADGADTVVEASFVRRSDSATRQARLAGSTVWLRILVDGDYAVALCSSDGTTWTSLQPSQRPYALRMREPRVGIAMTGPSRPFAWAAVNLDVARGQSLNVLPEVGRVVDGFDRSDGALSFSCLFHSAAGPGSLQRVRLAIGAPPESSPLTVTLGREVPDGPLSLLDVAPQSARNSLVGVATIEEPDGSVCVRVSLRSNAAVGDPLELYGRAVDSIGFDTGWRRLNRPAL